METIIPHLVENYGATGVTAAIGIYGLKALLPLAGQAVEHLSRMANAVQKLTLQLEAQGLVLQAVQREQAENGEDLAGLYALASQERPSRKRKPMVAVAGD